MKHNQHILHSKPSKSVSKKYSLKRPLIVALCFLVLGLAMLFITRYSRNAAEFFFARKVYPLYRSMMTFITGRLPFSLAEVLIILLPVVFIFYIFVTVRRVLQLKNKKSDKTGLNNIQVLHSVLPESSEDLPVFSSRVPPASQISTESEVLKPSPLRIVLHSLFSLFACACVIYFWYMLGCGTNYYRYEYADFCSMEIKKSSRDELYSLCIDLATRACDARTASKAPENEPFRNNCSDLELARRAQTAWNVFGLNSDLTFLNFSYPIPKPVHFSRFMSNFEITGVYFPWTCEANVNVDIPDYSIASTFCHELAHLTGFMREDEANYLAYVACVNSGDPALSYSGLMLALVYAGNRLYSESPDMYREVCSLYSQGMLMDLIEDSDYWKPFEHTTASKVGEAVNNAYLKANLQQDGTKSYGRMVDLLLAEQREKLKLASAFGLQ